MHSFQDEESQALVMKEFDTIGLDRDKSIIKKIAQSSHRIGVVGTDILKVERITCELLMKSTGRSESRNGMFCMQQRSFCLSLDRKLIIKLCRHSHQQVTRRIHWS